MSTANELEKIYQKNILYFQKFYPDIYEKLASHIQNVKYELMVDEAGYFNIEVVANGNKIYRDDSNLVAEAQVEHCITDNRDTKKVVFVGTLLGLQIEKMILQTDPSVVMIIEPDLELFKLSAFLIDYEILTKTRVTFFSVMDNDQELGDKILSFLFTMFYKNDNISFIKVLDAYQPIIDFIHTQYKENIFYTLDKSLINPPKSKKNINVTALVQKAAIEEKKKEFHKATQNYLQIIEYERYLKLNNNTKEMEQTLLSYLNLGNILYNQNKTIAESYHCYGKCIYSPIISKNIYEAALNNYISINTTSNHNITKMLSILDQYIQNGTTNISLITSMVELLYSTNQYARAENFMEQYKDLLKDSLHIATMLPPLPIVFNSQQEIDNAREKFEIKLDQLLEEKLTIPESRISIYSTFYFAYHNRNNKELFSKLSKFYTQSTPSITYTANHCKNYKHTSKKIKLGFISNFLTPGHPVLKMVQNLINSLIANTEYEIYIFAFSKSTQTIFPKHTILLDGNLKEYRKTISKHKLDVIIYPEIGMHPSTYVLAHARLAPVQCVMSGHPVTTGIQNVDYFFSSIYSESPKSQEYYSETLLLFHGDTGAYDKPTIPKELISKQGLGLQDDLHNYLIPSKLQKIHPDFDLLLSQFLHYDKKANFIFFNDKAKNQWDSFIKERLLKTIPAKHITFFPWAEHNTFYSLLHHADAVLEPLVFGYGTTSIQAFSIGTPIVTLPGDYNYGRATSAYYKIMGFEDLIATNKQEYINLAIKLATDKTFKTKAHDIIQKSNHLLYNNQNILTQYHDFFMKQLSMK